MSDTRLEKAQAQNLEHLKTAFEEARNYSNLVMFGGYAGAFAIWSFVHDTLSKQASALIAIFLGVSLTFFVSYEVIKALVSGVIVRRLAMLTEAKDDEEYALRHAAYVKSERRATTIAAKTWLPCALASILFSVLAFAVLFYNALAIL